MVPNASPFHVGKSGERIAQMARRAKAVGLPLVYAHLVGGQDEVVFDGASFAVNADGTLAARAPAFHEDLFSVAGHGRHRLPAVRPDGAGRSATRRSCGTRW